MQKIRLLLIEDSPSDAALILHKLDRGGLEIEIHRVESEIELQSCLQRDAWDFIIADYSLPGFNGLNALRIVKEKNLDIPFIFVSGSMGEDLAVEAIKAGAHDFLLKENLERLVPVMVRELREHKERVHRRHVEEALKASEEQLLQSQKMEAVGRLAGGIAHDFNNILLTIMGNTSLLRMKLGKENPIPTEINEIEKASTRATSLVNQLLTFTRKKSPNPKPIGLNELLSDMATMLRRLLGEDVRLELNLAENLHPVKSDPSQIEQIFLNLAINARDAMSRGGVMKLSTRNLRLQNEDIPPSMATDQGHYVFLEASDNGMGMNEATQAHIFEPFFTTKAPGKGTGLGLSTVFGIVEQMKGWIKVISSPNKGTVFRIWLPACLEQQTSLEETDFGNPKIQGSGELVLLVEDEPDLRKLLQEVLILNGYKVLVSETSLHALELAKEQQSQIRIMLTDVIMEHMNGMELSQEVKKHCPSIILLFMSGYTRDALKGQEISEDSIEFLRKPFSPTLLLTRLKALCERAR